MSFLNTLNRYVPDGIRIAAIFGATGILLGAFGSHALPKILEKKDTLKNGTIQDFKDIWKTAVMYQMIHAAALASSSSWPFKYRGAAVALMSVGVVLFSGSCYLVAFQGDRSNGKLAPYGGYSMIAGWLALLLA